MLDACLRSMRNDVEQRTAEVWVVENGSTDGSAELVLCEHPWAHLLELGENVGYGTAVNDVARRTRTPWIAASNADVELHPGALRVLLDAAERAPEAAAIGPRLILPDGRTQPSVQPFPGPSAALRAALGVDRLRRGGTWDPEHAAYVDWVTGAFLLVRREAWENVSGFDEAQWMYAEDLDLCWRIARAGWRIRYEPDAHVRHQLSAAAVQAFGPDLDDRWRAATWGWMARRRGVGLTWITAAIEAAAAGSRLAICTILVRLAPGERSRTRVVRARGDLRNASLGLRSRRTLLDAR